jgi:N-terminal domain of anti-restriction factor ArdC
MVEEINIKQTSQRQAVGTRAITQENACTANPSADRKPMVSWAALLDEAVKRPGFIHEAYSRFHNYSLGNQLLAMFQCFERGIQPGPLATWPKWKELGRYVKRGERALTLRMPVNCKRTRTVTKADGTEQDEEFTFTHFTYKAHWFVLTQTEGAEYKPAAIADWNEQKALEALNIQRTEFDSLDGNIQGYARRGRKITVSPIAALPAKTLFHEVAHVILGHTDERDLCDTERTPRGVREMEAEAVALLCCESLSLPGADYSRGYIQSWGQGEAFTERSAQRIFRAADQILRAGSCPA